MSRQATCLVAVDGSEASVQALVWSCRHATDRDMCVEVLTVWPPHGSVLIHEAPGHLCEPRWSALTAQEEAIRRALDEVPDGPIRAVRLENAETADAIVSALAGCDLVVLGSSSNHRTHRLTDRVMEQAPCEVVTTTGSSVAFPPQRLRKNFTA